MKKTVQEAISVFEKVYVKLSLIGDIDDLLNRRDDDQFSSDWTELSTTVEDLTKSLTIEDENKLTEFRKFIFLDLYEKHKSSDLSAYVSDDFDVIVRAYIEDFNNDFLASLLESYLRGEVPVPKNNDT